MRGSKRLVKCSGYSRNTMSILPWNARSLIAKQFIFSQRKKTDLLCIQESWLKPSLDFIINGYVTIRRDREDGAGGGCVTIVKEGIPYKIIGPEMEYVAIEVWWGETGGYKFNPCRKLELKKLEETGINGGRIEWCGDYNVHNMSWGSDKTD